MCYLQYVTSIFTKYRFGTRRFGNRRSSIVPRIRTHVFCDVPRGEMKGTYVIYGRQEWSYVDRMHDLSRSSCFHRCRRDLQYDEGRRGGGERWVVQIALLTRTRCTMCSDRSRGEKPREAEDSKDRRYVLPHPARDFRQSFSRFRVIPYASILV